MILDLADVFLFLSELCDFHLEVVEEDIKMSINDLSVEGRSDVLLLVLLGVLSDRCH